MPINVLCPNCDSRFNLQDDLLGKKMVCPVCREIFVVEIAPVVITAPPETETAPKTDKPATSRSDAPTPKYQTGSITDFLDVLEVEAAGSPAAPANGTKASTRSPATADVFTDFEVIEDEEHQTQKAKSSTTKSKGSTAKPLVLEAVPDPQETKSTTAKPKPKPLVLESVPEPKEVVWSADMDLPSSGNVGVAPPTDRDEYKEDEYKEDAADDDRPPQYRTDEDESVYDRDDDEPVDRDDRSEIIRPRKKKSRLVMIFFLLMVIGGAVATGGYFLRHYMVEAPKRLYVKAKKEYEAKNYEPARKLFEELIKEYPKYEKNNEARFFMELCGVKLSIYSTASTQDPSTSQKLLDKFLKTIEDPALKEFAEPGKFNSDIWEPALKLTEDVTQKAQNSFKQDTPDDAVPWLDQAENLGKIVDRFRPKDGQREHVYEQMSNLRTSIASARTRLQKLVVVGDMLKEPDDNAINDARKYISENGYAQDISFTRLVDDAERKIQGAAGFKRIEPPIKAARAGAQRGTGLLFVSRVDQIKPMGAPAGAQPGVFFALARGILYALDENDGHVLWATRVGIDSETLPLQVASTALNQEMVLVVENDGKTSSITARDLQKGDAIWRQPLPSAAYGKPVQVGPRAYVSLRDPPVQAGERQRRDNMGVALEIELFDGSITGRISLGRSIGGQAVRRPGTGQLYFPAEAQGVYVFDVDKRDADGVKADPQYLGMLATGHTAGSLRGEPIITADQGSTPSNLILSIADGLEGMNLKGFPLTPPGQPAGIAGNPASVHLNGWTWFVPYSDVEKFAVVTDRGDFEIFGIKQPGNADVPIFKMPDIPSAIGDARSPTRGLIVNLDESDYWFMAQGALYHFRPAFDALHGPRTLLRGTPMQLGQPLHAAQVARRDTGTTGMVVTQASGSASIRATAINLRTGAVRWQRQLGFIAQGDPVRIGDAIVMMDTDGGIYQLDAKSLAEAAKNEWVIDERWLVERPMAFVAGLARMIPAPDGSSIYAVIPTHGERGLRMTIRHFTPGNPAEDHTANVPAPLAGNPTIVGNAIILPLANGMLYRMGFDSDKLEAGPTWRGERVQLQSICHLAAVTDDDFVASDGANTLASWHWGKDPFNKRGEVALPTRIAATPIVVVNAGTSQVFVADMRGNVTMWDANKPVQGAQPLRAWRPSAKGLIPTGPLTTGPFLERDSKGKPCICYVINGVNVVWISPDADAPVWVSQRQTRSAGDGVIGRPYAMGNRLYTTDRSGSFQALDLATGESKEELAHLKGNAPASIAIPIDEKLLFAPVSDGTVRLLQIETARAMEAEEKKPENKKDDSEKKPPKE